MTLTKYSRSTSKTTTPNVRIDKLFKDLTFMDIWISNFIQTDKKDIRAMQVFTAMTDKNHQFFAVTQNRFLYLFFKFYYTRQIQEISVHLPGPQAAGF